MEARSDGKSYDKYILNISYDTKMALLNSSRSMTEPILIMA